MIYTYFPDRPEWRGGRRFVVLFHQGRKWLKLLDTGTLETYLEPVTALRSLRPYKITPATLANRLVKRRAAFKRQHINFSQRSTDRAITALRTGNG